MDHGVIRSGDFSNDDSSRGIQFVRVVDADQNIVAGKSRFHGFAMDMDGVKSVRGFSASSSSANVIRGWVHLNFGIYLRTTTTGESELHQRTFNIDISEYDSVVIALQAVALVPDHACYAPVSRISRGEGKTDIMVASGRGKSARIDLGSFRVNCSHFRPDKHSLRMSRASENVWLQGIDLGAFPG
ncbi:hypothetical protein FIBSPDRAFT_926870 [Athelia psychrophila]|uniref:Uncharacterized protein n=1 Tax=Athelia psychrophila TaxID=1759441 RepID=A0A166SQI1_9AGAM|nr:hypothetical protein FIBSPDRAFT_926870 [Fibularhizoctonia sp. CBS 109695]